MAPERADSPQEETVLTPKMSVPGSPVAGTPIRDAQSPISILLAVAQSQSRSPDDDLTSLNWLHDRDLLKGMNINPSPSNSVSSTPVKNFNNNCILEQSVCEFIEVPPVQPVESSCSTVNSSLSYQNQNGCLQRLKHPHNIPYDPLVHTNNKPPYSFSCLIFMAIEDSVQKALPVKEIYTWILDHFPYFKNAPTGWKNSVRHNLSLNKCFQKVEKAPNLGKGSLWTVDPQYKPNLIQALNRSPFQPRSSLDQPSYISNKPQQASSEKSSNCRLPNPDLFPYLSRKLATAEMNYHPSKSKPSDETLDAVDAAAVMLSLKNGVTSHHKRDRNSWQVITTSPSQDHTYSAADSVNPGQIDEEERIPKNRICRKIDFEDEEERKIKEGAETLLNLAEITMKRRLNQDINEEDSPKKKSSTQFNLSKSEPFKPRLLRTKKKENIQRVVFNNNNDEWVKHRREIESKKNR